MALVVKLIADLGGLTLAFQNAVRGQMQHSLLSKLNLLLDNLVSAVSPRKQYTCYNTFVHTSNNLSHLDCLLLISLTLTTDSPICSKAWNTNLSSMYSSS